MTCRHIIATCADHAQMLYYSNQYAFGLIRLRLDIPLMEGGLSLSKVLKYPFHIPLYFYFFWDIYWLVKKTEQNSVSILFLRHAILYGTWKALRKWMVWMVASHLMHFFFLIIFLMESNWKIKCYIFYQVITNIIS